MKQIVQCQPIPNTNLQSPEGWNLIGNPYPSPIDFDKMSLNKPASMQNSYYHWDGVSELYISYVNSISSDTLFNNNVGPFQSFFVRIDPNNQVNAQYQFTDAVRDTDPDEVISPFLKLNRKLFRLRIEGQGSFNHTVVYFEPSATALFDSDYDAYYLNSGQSNPIEFASVTPNNLVSINGLPLNSSISQTTIPLYTSVAVAGTYEISLEEFTNFEVGELVILNDLLLSTSHVLNNSSYVFQASPNDPTNRFEINATNPNVILPVSVSSNNVNCSSFYPNPTTDYVNYNYYSIDNKSLTLSVSDISGITIYKSNYNAVFGTNNILLDFKNYPSGSYIINVSDDNNQIVDKQTIIKE